VFILQSMVAICKLFSSIISFGRTLDVFKIALCCCVSADELLALNTVEKVKWLKACVRKLIKENDPLWIQRRVNHSMRKKRERLVGSRVCSNRWAQPKAHRIVRVSKLNRHCIINVSRRNFLVFLNHKTIN